jgi:hypothetical protein
MNRLGTLLLVLALGASAGTARATPGGQAAMQNWGQMDKCAREAQTAFPDYSAESYAKRDAKLRECLEGKSLPPRVPLAPGN